MASNGHISVPPGAVRLATASPGSQATTKQTMVQLEQIARQAAQNKADILLLPEAYLGGYPSGSDFGCKVGARDPKGREEYLAYFKQAVDLGDTVGEAGGGAGDAWVKRSLAGGGSGGGSGSGSGDAGTGVDPRGDGMREELERIARETGVFIVVGLVEKAGGSLYCSAVYVCPARGMIGKRRKVMPTGTERLIWAQGSPATLKAVSTVIRGTRINMSAAICWENYMPLLRQAIYAQNVNLYLAPTADGRDTWMSLMRTVALEGRCFVVSSNMCVRENAGGVGGNAATTQVALKRQHDHQHQQQPAAARARRNSCMTEEGFEIALPSPVTAASTSATTTSRTRRRSVLDEDGNEIVLCKQQQHKEEAPFRDSIGSRNNSTVVIEEDDENDTATATNGEKHVVTFKDANSATTGTGTFISRGGSSIISPTGDIVAGPQWEDDTGILYADVDFDDCIRGRLDLDAAGSYSRNDSFKFSVTGLDLDPLPYN
ncbi:carbon-nitrogen hydrolase [Microdochium bolleyi]|uniref:Carbon-nitrogen hydrolase n=1 Tax=Microdochium bolleyi TaxID=196109 RepID=A0A136IPI8_9PEZI|nr:carbon-nitrogen hydrolase [Microdochium bolleyi]